MTNDQQFVDPPPICAPGGDGASSNAHNSQIQGPPPGCDSITILKDTAFICSGQKPSTHAPSPSGCCQNCQSANKALNRSCSHWSWFQNGTCAYWSGTCERKAAAGATSGVQFHPPHPPNPPPPRPDDGHCHASSYSSTLYGELALRAVREHDAKVPLFLYLPFQVCVRVRVCVCMCTAISLSAIASEVCERVCESVWMCVWVCMGEGGAG